MRRLLRGAGLVVVAVLGLGLAVWGEAHWEIRHLEPELPSAEALAERLLTADGPTRVGYLNTATQEAPGIGVIAYPAFLLGWTDGRLFLIDTGMDRPGAEAFGRPFERLLGARPIEPHGSIAEQADLARVAGVGFTHLHNDHTGGLASLCTVVAREVPVFQTPWQAELGNYTTRAGRRDLAEAACARPHTLTDGPLFGVPGFPGLVAIEAGGHTPGSTLWAARVGERIWVFAGDVANERRALLDDRPKPAVYSLFVVPEAPRQLQRLRLWLADLDARPEFRVVVSHDRDALRESGPPPWTQGDARGLAGPGRAPAPPAAPGTRG